MSFPIHSVHLRQYPPDWSGEVFVCDVDRTYLDTRFSSLKSLARIPFETAVDKRTIAGMAALLKEVRRGPDETSRHTPLYFVSASPAQLRRVIERKMLLDGVEFDGTTFKDWTRVIRRGRLRKLREQLGYKLAALLTSRQGLPPGAQEILLGDDLEIDALAYSLYADILAGRIPLSRLPGILQRNGVARDDARAIAGLKVQVGNMAGVRRALIRLERSENPEALLGFWPHVVPCLGAFQMALALWDQGSVSAQGALRVAAAMRAKGRPAEAVEEQLRDLRRRGLLGERQAQEMAQALLVRGLAQLKGPLPAVDPAWQAVVARDEGRPWTPGRFRGG